MKLLLIYGAPAAGKLTVSLEIARRTGFKVFHNHLSIDCVKPVFEFGSQPFWRVVKTIRYETIAEAARTGIDLIHTFCYEFKADDEQFRELISAAENNGGEVHLVLLRCDPDELKRRIGNESRLRIGKLADPESVDRSLVRYDLLSPLPGRETLILETTNIQPEETARLIIEHFGLQQSVVVENDGNK
jgi:broad-specificity NMP kinase